MNQEALQRKIADLEFHMRTGTLCPNLDVERGVRAVLDRVKELEEEVAKGPGRRRHTHEWYERHYGKLHDWARRTLPEPFRNQFFSCIANGLYGHDDLGKPYKTVAGFMVTPGGHFKMDSAQEQILFDQCVRAEDAEAENERLKAQLKTVLDREAESQGRHDRKVGALEAQIAAYEMPVSGDELHTCLDLRQKVHGPESVQAWFDRLILSRKLPPPAITEQDATTGIIPQETQ